MTRVILSFLCLAWASSAVFGQDLRPVPRPVLDHVEPPDRELLESRRAVLDGLLDAGETDQKMLAGAFSAVGRIYALHDFSTAAVAALSNATLLEPNSFSDWYYLGLVLQLDSDLEKAVVALNRARALRPDDLPTLIRLGQVAFDLGDLAMAREAFEAALARDERCAAAEYGLGQIAAASNDTDEAIARFQRALELQPTATSIHHPLGMVYRQLGDLDRAREHLAANQHGQVLFSDPLMIELSRLLRGARALAKNAKEALDRGQFGFALALLRMAQEANPEDAIVVHNIGWLEARAGRHSEAIRYFQRALEIDPGYRDAHYNLAVALTEVGRLEEATEHYEATYRIDPLDHSARLAWAQSLVRIEQDAQARRELEGLLEEIPGGQDEILGRTQLSLGQLSERTGSVESAIEQYQTGLRLVEDVESRASLARLLGQTGRFQDAAEQLGRVVAERPQDVEARFGQVMALLLANQEVEAGEVAATGLEVMPEDLVLAHLLARIRVAASDPAARDGQQGLALAQRVLEQSPTPVHAETLAMAFAEVGRFDDAVQWQERVVSELTRRRAPEEEVNAARSRLLGYRQNQPCRQPWSGG